MSLSIPPDHYLSGVSQAHSIHTLADDLGTLLMQADLPPELNTEVVEQLKGIRATLERLLEQVGEAPTADAVLPDALTV
jgi:hypothetical protein